MGDSIACAEHRRLIPLRPHLDQPDPVELDQEPGDFERAWWHMEQAERRMREVLDALDQAKVQGASPDKIAELETAYQHEVTVRDAALPFIEHPDPNADEIFS
jgi:hypothetical protein